MKKIKLESSEEIADIVRAIQKGEEPEEYLKKKKEEQREAEEKRKAAERAAREEKEAAERAAREEKEAAGRAAREEEEAARAAAEQERKTAEKAAAQERRAEAKAFVAEKTGEIKRRIIRGNTSVENNENNEKDTAENIRKSADEGTKPDVISENADEHKIKRRYGSKSVSENADKVGKQILRSLNMEINETDESKDNIHSETEEPENDIHSETEEPENDIHSETEELENDIHNGTEKPGDDQDLRQEGSDIPEKGKGKRRILLTGIVIFIAVLIVIAVIFSVNYANRISEKRKYVTADDGLTVTVENQPEEWCSSCELGLKFSLRRGKISEIVINDTAYQTDEKGYVTVEAGEHFLNAKVSTDDGTWEAVVEIPKLDSDAPVLSVSVTDDMISLSAADDYSDVDQILYAKVSEDNYIDLPLYQVYTEPFLYEEGTLYYFYASDMAGNCSTPIVTTTAEAESIEIREDEITLYPGETKSIGAEIVPKGALAADIAYESSDTDVAAVDRYGNITAVSDGSAVIKISAAGLPEAACMVKVVSRQTVTISAIGDVTLGSDINSDTMNNLDAYYIMNGSSYFFDNVRDILEDDDLTFANLEGPLTTAQTSKDKQYVFKGDPSYTGILQDGSIEVVSLANNHSEDYGEEGLSDTKEYLTEAGIEYCKEDIIAYEEVSGIKIAFIGIMELDYGISCETMVRETIEEAQSAGAQIIVVAFHWGIESSSETDETQQYLAHVAVDCGADLVVGHHPHVLQGIEKYNGKYIVYSLGNFCFGGNTNPSDKDTIIFRQTFTIDQNGVADDDNIEIIPCTVSAVSEYNNYQPSPADESKAEEIMERINEYSVAFGDITYTASVY